MSQDDVVASRSGFLCQYMSHHQDTLVAYVKYFGERKGNVTSARMTAIDGKSMSLEFVEDGTTQTIRLLIEPPLEIYDEVKPRLIAMREEALEGLGMDAQPVIKEYRLPDARLALPVVGLLSLLIYTTFAASPSIGAQIRSAVGGMPTLKAIWGFVFVTHLGESVYMAGLCKRHKTGVPLGSLWVLSVAACGFPFWIKFRQIVQQARIASIKKT
ncbi:hypothetical protein RhiJN_23627 [Ceratobasidium sp. AG-Ba]|nr:hypothetical protein RhiJN_23627 [Ceratobasidium sp. AG-Ba]